jgi:hypothetical protein
MGKKMELAIEDQASLSETLSVFVQIENYHNLEKMGKKMELAIEDQASLSETLSVFVQA